MEIATRVLTPDEHRLGMTKAEQFYRSKGIKNVLIAYGWGCDCPDEELYQDKLMSLDQFPQFVTSAEIANYYRVSKDNLYFKDECGRSEFLFCHEADIHFKTEDAGLQEEVQAFWQSMGFGRSRSAS